jgi:putative ATP-grasp target RiPP
MFSQADRLPACRSQESGTDGAAVRPPWGLSRMRHYPEVIEILYTSAVLDPETQTGLYFDAAGRLVEMKHKKTNRATEQKTRVSKGDGNSPSSYDSDTTQDSETD